MQMDSYPPGMPSWVDLSTPDPAAAAQFYSALFGWEVTEGPPEAGGYAMCHLGGQTVAGIGPQQYPGPPVWSTYVNVTDADAIMASVTASGGSVVMPPMDVLDAGRGAMFTDPAGAVFGVWQPARHAGAGVVNEPGALCWNELVTTDVAGAERFYAAVFGWGARTQGEPGPQAYTEWQLAGRSIGGLMAKPADMPPEVPPFWMAYFAVADTDANLRQAQALGASVVVPATDISAESGRFAVLADPAGAMFGVLAMPTTD
jgi:predicted enzyme related to lactoylglutathione lyase